MASPASCRTQAPSPCQLLTQRQRERERARARQYASISIPGGLLGRRPSAGSNTQGLLDRSGRHPCLSLPLLRSCCRSRSGLVHPHHYFALGCRLPGRQSRGDFGGRRRGRVAALRIVLLRVCLECVRICCQSSLASSKSRKRACHAQ